MPAQSKSHEPKTAVLVVPGMGSQRPLATLRGIVGATLFARPQRSVP